MENAINITGCLIGCDCERCSGWMLAPGQEDARQLLRGGVTLIEFDLDDLQAAGCNVVLYRDTRHLGERALIKLPDNRHVTCGFRRGMLVLDEASAAIVKRQLSLS